MPPGACPAARSLARRRGAGRIRHLEASRYYGITMWRNTPGFILASEPAARSGCSSLSVGFRWRLAGCGSFRRRRVARLQPLALIFRLGRDVVHGLILRQDLFWLPFGFALFADRGLQSGHVTSESASRLRWRVSGCVQAQRRPDPRPWDGTRSSLHMLPRPPRPPLFLHFLSGVHVPHRLTYTFVGRETRGNAEELDLSGVEAGSISPLTESPGPKIVSICAVAAVARAGPRGGISARVSLCRTSVHTTLTPADPGSPVAPPRCSLAVLSRDAQWVS